MNLAEVDPALEVVERWLERRVLAGATMGAALEALARRTLVAWSRRATSDARLSARRKLDSGRWSDLSTLLAGDTTEAARGEADSAPTRTHAREASSFLQAVTQAHGAEAFEAVGERLRRTGARYGARFVADRARSAIDESMGPMHATVVAADLLASLEAVDRPYLEALSYTLETLHGWGAVTDTTGPTSKKTRTRRAKGPRALSPQKRRA